MEEWLLVLTTRRVLSVTELGEGERDTRGGVGFLKLASWGGGNGGG